MKTFFLGDCQSTPPYLLVDPDATLESEFEFLVATTLKCAYPEYRCIVFGGGFRYNEEISRPDLALVANDFSHWFVIEVELTSHSLRKHVLPQARAFAFGEPEPDCATILSRELGIDHGRALTLVNMVPRSVAIIANKRDNEWVAALLGLTAQFLVLSTYTTSVGDMAAELDGSLEVIQQSLGFGRYIATDRSLRFPRTFPIDEGRIQINDPAGAPSLWIVSKADNGTWVIKETGNPDFEDGSLIQIIRTVDGSLSFRRPRLSSY